MYEFVQVFTLYGRIKSRKFHIRAIKNIIAEKTYISFTEFEQ